MAHLKGAHITINFLYFLYNYPPGWIQGAWHYDKSLANHLENKFSVLWNKHGSHFGILKFIGELSDNNKEVLINWVTDNYNHKS